MDKAATVVERVVQACAVLLAALYLVTGVAYLCLDYWPVTRMDFWRLYEICLTHSWWQSATLKFNGHSLFFPSFIWLADLHFFRGNQAVIFYVSLALLILSTLGFLLPIWRDRSIDLTNKLTATLVMVAASFWMGRGSITVSGGFACMNSLVVISLAGALLVLWKGGGTLWRDIALLVCAGYVASFSFGTGLAIWPCLILLGWCLRMPWRNLAVLAVGAVGAGLIFQYLPPHSAALAHVGNGSSPGGMLLPIIENLSRLLGAPIFYSALAWKGTESTTELVQSSGCLLWSGMLGLACATVLVVLQLVRRKPRENSLEFIGLGVVTFSLAAFLLIVAGRLDYFHKMPGQLAAQRYLFWSSLFWAGLILMAMGAARGRSWWRWSCIFLIFAAAIFGWQAHRKEGLRWRYSRLLTEQAVTSLLNGVHDSQGLLFRDQRQIDLLAPKLRRQRLDMFAEGLQDWIGQPASALFQQSQRNRFRGQAHLELIEDGAARIKGQAYIGKGNVPPTMVILNSEGTIVGIARSFATNRFLDWALFGDKMPYAPIFGYIRQYDPRVSYIIRSGNGQEMSDSAITLMSPSGQPPDSRPIPHRTSP